MSLILNIDTALETAFVSLAENGNLLKFRSNDKQKDHAAWIHESICDLMNETGFSLQDLKAVAVSNGPGSYTGLRVSLSTAKGFCYALKIPLISISTLDLMAAAAINQSSKTLLESIDLLCPMIDARRMEVYLAVYDKKLNEIVKAQALILSVDFFTHLLKDRSILFVGNGSYKFKDKLLHNGAIFADDINPGAIDMSVLSFAYFKHNRFAELAYSEPLYIKDFFTSAHKPLK
jgi:tRNA threonylcarbamoyladenosine biosynthesis protein TsaB